MAGVVLISFLDALKLLFLKSNAPILQLLLDMLEHIEDSFFVVAVLLGRWLGLRGFPLFTLFRFFLDFSRLLFVMLKRFTVEYRINPLAQSLLSCLHEVLVHVKSLVGQFAR